MSVRPQMLDLVRRSLRQRKTVVLTGPAGIGKSHLARRAVERTDAAFAQCLAAFEEQSLRPLAHALGAPLYGSVDDVATDVAAWLAGRCLVVEDLHWADARTSAVVTRLIGRVPLVVTSREPTELNELDDVTELRVPPLTPDEAAALADRAHDGLDAADRASLLEAAGGNPLLLLNLSHGDVVSPTLGAAVRERLSRAAPETIGVLARLALHGRPAPRHWIALPSSADAEGMVTISGDGYAWFAHDLFAREVLALLDGDEIADQRRRLVDLSDDSDAARHLYELGNYERAADLAERAAADADPNSRADLLALAVAARGPSASSQLRLAAAEAMLVAHRTAEVRELTAAVEGDRVAQAEAAFLRAQAEWLDGNAKQAVAEIEAALNAAAGTGADIEVRAIVEQALFLVRMRVGDPDIIPIADEAATLARERGVATARALNVSGLARSHTGTDGWRLRFDEAAAIAEAEGDLDETLAANYWIVSSLGFYGPMVEAAIVGQELVERTGRLRSRRWHHHFLAANFVHRSGLSRVDHSLLEATARLLEHEPLFRNRSQLDMIRVCVLCDLDLHAEAVEALATGRRFARNDEDAALMAIAAAEVALQQRDREAMRAAVTDVEAIGAGFFGLNVLLESAAIHLSVTDPIEHIPRFSARLTPTLGVVAIERNAHDQQAAGELSAAWRTMRTAAETWADQSMLRFAYRAYLSSAQLAVAADELDAAAGQTGSARELRDRMQPTPSSVRLDAVARSIERTRARKLLTPRAVEVLELVGEGSTTKEIAARLGIGEATVDSHVGQAMQRLGCTTRMQAAARVV